MPVATPTLAILDLADGSQVTATVSGATTGTTNTIKAQKVRDTGSSSWESLGSRVGDGELTVDAGAKGPHWFLCSSTDGSTSAISNLVYAGVTNTTDALYDRIVDGVVARIQQLDLVGLPPSQVIRQDLFVLENLSFPCVVVVLQDLTENEEGEAGSNERDDCGFPCRIVILDHNNREPNPKRLLWRQQIWRALRHQRLSGVTQVFKCIVTPLTAFDARLKDADFYWSGLETRHFVRDERGLT